MIGPDGLLIVVSHLFAVPILVLSMGLEKGKQLNLDVRNILAGHILSYSGATLINMACQEGIV
jgi:hypothetical protein